MCLYVLYVSILCAMIFLLVIVFVIISLFVFLFIYVSIFIYDDCRVAMHLHVPCIMVLYSFRVSSVL